MFMEDKSQVCSEFQAIIFTGKSTSLDPLTASTPKALLPIGNKPMLYYTLKWLEQALVSDIIICTQDKPAIEEYLAKYFQSNKHATIRLIDSPDSSCDALKQCRNYIHADFIVLSCDLISEFDLATLLNQHVVSDSTMTCLLYDYTTDPKLKKEYCCMMNDRILMFGDGDLELKASIVKKFPRIKIYSQYKDARLYIFKKWIIDLVSTKKLTSIKRDLVPLLLSYQYKPELLKDFEIPTDLLLDARLLSSSNQQIDQYVCLGVFHSNGFTCRMDTIANYTETNRWIVKQLDRIAESATIDEKTQVGLDSMVGEGTTIDARCSIKKSILGNHCTIGKNVKMSNSILMDYVTIEDGVKLDGVVVCQRAKISARAQLKDVNVGGACVVDEDAILKNENVTK